MKISTKNTINKRKVPIINHNINKKTSQNTSRCNLPPPRKQNRKTCKVLQKFSSITKNYWTTTSSLKKNLIW